MTQTVPDISPLMPMHQDPLLVDILRPRQNGSHFADYIFKSIFLVGVLIALLVIYTLQLVPIRLLLQWRHNERDGVSNHQPRDCLLNHLFRRKSKKTSKLHVTGLCEGNSPGTGEFPAQRASNVENVSIWWRHHVMEAIKGHLRFVNQSPYLLISTYVSPNYGLRIS